MPEQEQGSHLDWADELGEFYKRLSNRHNVPATIAGQLTVDYQKLTFGLDEDDEDDQESGEKGDA